MTRTNRRRRRVAALAALAVAAGIPLAAGTGGPAGAAPAGDDISPAVAAQIAAIQAEKESRTPAEQKVDSNLLYAVRQDEDGVAVDGAPALRSTVVAPRGVVLVDLEGEVTDSLLQLISDGGGKVVASVAAFDAVRARVPLDLVRTIAARPEVRGVRAADEATTNRRAGGDATTASVGNGANEADVTMAANTARTTYGVDGSGVKVCVLSDGVSTLAQRQQTGDLPAVDVLPGQAGTGDEGTAMLELIHDIAPGASLGFATAFSGVASFAQNILDLRTSGCKVIVDDVTYFSEPTFQDGPIAQAISTVRAAGVVYFSSAGNSGNFPDGTSGTWMGDFQDAGTSQSPLSLGLRVHGWGVGATYNAITKAGSQINLQWSDALGASANDYDLYLLSSDGTSVTSSSTNIQSGTQDPVESLASSPLGGRVMVVKKTAAASRYLALYTNRGRLTYGTGGAGRGHNVSLDAVSVAATPAANAFDGSSPTGPFPSVHSGSNLSELFSSDGPTRQFFTPAGAAITPGNFGSTGGVSRNGVDITAPDGVVTTTPGFTRFYGTSAAAPNAAAVAALAFEAKPSLTPNQLESALGATATDIEAAGYDPVTGAGIVNAPLFLQNVGATAKARLTAGSRSVSPQTGDGDSYLEPGETANITQLLTNVGSAPATAISATLESQSPYATVTQPTVTYGNIAANATGSPNSLPLRISVSSTCPCGTSLPFQLTVTYSGGVQSVLNLNFAVAVGQPAAPVDVAYTGPVVAIPDNSPTGATAAVAVASTASVSQLTVTIGGSTCSSDAGSTTVGLDHTYLADLTATLTSPKGTTVELFSGTGVAGNNLCKTVLSDGALADIQGQPAATAPFTGSFRPKQALSAFVGENPAGTWTLKVSDGASGDTGSIRAFSLQIAGYSCTNLVPKANGDGYTTGQDTTLNVSAPGVLANDSDPEGSPLTAALSTLPAHGSVTLNPNGSFTYIPTAGYAGPDSFTYRVYDGTSYSTAATVGIVVDGTPVTGAESYTTGKGVTLDVSAPGVLANDSDPEDQAITAVKASNPSNGTLTLNPNGSFTYVPAAGFTGTDSFGYRATDGRTSSPIRTVQVKVNAPPTVVANSYTATAGSTLNVAAPGVLGNDSDAEGDPFSASLVSGPSHGSLTLNGNGSFAYTPTVGYLGGDSFTYKAVDAWGASGAATVSITVNAANQAPGATADTYDVVRNQALIVSAPGVLGNDTDPEAQPLSAVLASGPTSGTLTLNPNGSFTYTPATNFSGTATFTYKASDGSLQSAAATVTLKVNGRPTVANDSYTVAFDTPLTVSAPGVLGNDADPDGDAMTAAKASDPSHGTVTVNANGSFTYTPTSGYSGPDSFTYKASDAKGPSPAATVNLTVNALGNAAPSATGESYRVVVGRTLTRSAPGVLGNDTDPDGDDISASLVTGPAHGTLGLNANGSFTYTPTAGYAGADSFTYKATDGTLASTPVTVDILVITATAAYVDAVYGDFLNRVADPSGMAYWGGRLDRGAETRTSFVLKMSRSHEYAVKIVTRAFKDTLGRTPDPSGREYWANKVQKGMPIATLILNLIASNEYLTKTGGTTAGFVDSTFKAILGRLPSSSERTSRVNAINAGTSRLKVASDLYASSESRRRRVRYVFDDLLGRTPSQAELDLWVGRLATKSDVDLAIALGASDEYVARSAAL